MSFYISHEYSLHSPLNIIFLWESLNSCSLIDLWPHICWRVYFILHFPICKKIFILFHYILNRSVHFLKSLLGKTLHETAWSPMHYWLIEIFLLLCTLFKLFFHFALLSCHLFLLIHKEDFPEGCQCHSSFHF